ncbi:MAG: hypothetical protein NWT08_15320 [Akkermansiaceae bacterium]|nr:hypothetical protein [Akkermansiaceae bacterium]MDP4646520.1 hypothetical protein [Akkermansiaceae bacterium]MDP4720483.1 hypothetical protein [Akkermansiaceae bacterium]MDP4779319.1 hypothetical protein [Akkermansiaceae bacterium]MDP4846483.1 hypothetical protein [Akkermansiaceae bacterium]
MKIKMSWARTVAMIASMLVATGEESIAGDFIRVKETEESTKLQTAVFGYEKDGVRVDLIGAIHIADKHYYEFLNKWFENYEVLLFEMVGGENLGGGKKPALVEEPAEKEENKLAGLGKLYGAMEKALGLSGQGALIDYFAENFVHADLTMKEFEALQEERGESMLSFMIQAGLSAEKPEKDPNSIRLMRGILTGRSDLVKLELMHTMAAGDTQIDSVGGENVIIADRNAKCMQVLEREIGEGNKKIGIFYGAAHFPDMERRMLEMGFERVSEKWLTAWRVANQE